MLSFVVKLEGGVGIKRREGREKKKDNEDEPGGRAEEEKIKLRRIEDRESGREGK